MKRHSNKYTLLRRIPNLKDRAVRTELGRAHLLIALLSFALFMTLVMSLQPYYAPDRTLTILASVLLVLVGTFSLAVSIHLYSKK